MVISRQKIQSRNAPCAPAPPQAPRGMMDDERTAGGLECQAPSLGWWLPPGGWVLREWIHEEGAVQQARPRWRLRYMHAPARIAAMIVVALAASLAAGCSASNGSPPPAPSRAAATGAAPSVSAAV